MDKTHLKIVWKDGSLEQNGGVQVEDVIQAAINRLKTLNQPPFKRRENSLAITDLESAQNWLNRRTDDRIKRGVEGTQEP